MKSTPVRYHLGKFPPKTLDWARLIPLIGPANAGLARYDGLLTAIPNAHVLLSPLTTQEAVLSSKIEGTNITIGEVLEIEAGGESATITQPKRDDAEEVLNYRKAMQACVAEMEYRPLSQDMLRAVHRLLMQGVRGRDKSPGDYRKVRSKKPHSFPLRQNIYSREWMIGRNIWAAPPNRTYLFSLPSCILNLKPCTLLMMVMVASEGC